LTDAQRRALTAMAERLTGDLASLRIQQRAMGEAPAGGWLCRLCDFDACGRPAGQCPAARAARR
jgi:rubrerythrin